MKAGMSKRLNNIFSATDCLSAEILIAYAENRLEADEKYLVEKHLLDCQFCTDALEGISSLKDKSKLKPALSELSKKIDSYSKERKTRVIYFDFRRSMAAAAVLVFLVGVTFIFRYYLLKQDKEMVAQRTVKESRLEQKEKNKISESPSGQPDQSIQNGLNEEKANENKVTADITKNEREQSGASEGENENIPFLPKGTVLSGEKTEDDQQTFGGYYRSLNFEAATGSTAEKNDADNNLKNQNDVTLAKDKSEVQDQEKEETIAQNNTTVATETKSTTTATSDYKNNTPEKSVKKESNKQKNYEAPVVAGNTGVVVSDELTDKRYTDGVQFYQNTDYSGCVTQMQSYLGDAPDDANANYYCGVSQYFLAQYDSAITLLSEVVKNKKNSFYETAQWYLSLSYIGKDDTKEAEKILKDIVKAKGSFKTQAEEELLELEKK